MAYGKMTHFLFVNLLLAAVLWTTVVIAANNQVFTSTPKDKEVFVGESIQFDWDYIKNDTDEVRFGVILNTTEVTICKFVLKDRTTIFNNRNIEVKNYKDRVEIVSDRRASFRIKNVRMSDRGTYFCSLVNTDAWDSISSSVKMTVVDLLIDKFRSSISLESWDGHKIQVTCAVNVSADTNVTFSWMHIPSNTSVAKQLHEDLGSKSHLLITTYEDKDFEALQCRAETKNTVKFHVVNITRLSTPSRPRNLKSERIFDPKNAQTYFKLHWEPPENNGGTGISEYTIHYVPKELSWKDATTEKTTSNELNLKLESGEIYLANVRARNKVGVGPASNEIELNLDASTFPVMYSLSSTVTAVRGSDVKLVCKGSNVQPLDTHFMWKFNNETVENKENRNTKVTWLPGKRAKYSLDILNVSEKDVGDYRCIAQVHNFLKIDKAEASIKLRLYESILNLTASPPNVIIEEGRTAPLQCEVMCSEAMDVWTFWLFNGKMIEARPFHTGNEHDLSNTVTNISTFVLKNAMLSQTGVYTCGANSTGLIKTQNITVTVTDLEGPTLVQTKSNIDAVDGQNITLSCYAVYPEAFFVDTFWIFNGSRINSNDKYKEKNTSPWLEQSEQSVKRMKIGLTIYNVGLNDSGEYICALNTSLSLQLKNVSVKVRRRLGTEIPPDLSSSTEGDNGNGDVLQTSLCIGLGVFVGLLMIIMISLTLWRRSRPRPPQSNKSPQDLEEVELVPREAVTSSSV